MTKSRWSDVKKGDRVKVGTRWYDVVKVKPKGKEAKVALETKGRRSEGVVKLADKVEIQARKKKSKREPLTDGRGGQQRWATEAELAESMSPIAVGNSRRTAPPASAAGGPWELPADRIERKLDEILGARLVAESKDEAEGYFVPPVDITTVASHLVIFHGGVDPEQTASEMLRQHAADHEAALKGAPLHKNHWHEERRP